VPAFTSRLDRYRLVLLNCTPRGWWNVCPLPKWNANNR